MGTPWPPRMAFAEELLALAQDIANLPSDTHRQANLRRAVSTAYYALFHLLISEATLNWARPELRAMLGRLFDHGPMCSASDKKEADLNAYFKGNPPESPERTVAQHLLTVCKAFAQAQQRRVDADYNVGREVTETETLTQIESVREAFRSWNLIRDEPTGRRIFFPCWAIRIAGRRRPILRGNRSRARVNRSRRSRDRATAAWRCAAFQRQW
jgi:hypothetical protein